MEDASSKYPSLPSNYVSILQLQERWIKEQQRIQEEKERQQDRESHSPTGENDTTEDDTRPKFKGRRKFRQNGGKPSSKTDERSQKPKWSEQDRAKIEYKPREPRAAKVKADSRTSQVESRNTKQVKVGGRKPESLEVQKDGRTVEDSCQKSEVETMFVVGEEIKDDEQKTAGKKKKKKKKKKNGRTNPRAEEELAGGNMRPASENGSEEKFPGKVNQMDGIHCRMKKLSVDPWKLGGSHGSTSTHRNGYQRKPGVPGKFTSRKASDAGLVWVRKGEFDGNVASTSCSGGSGRQR